jgi:hypothetical protein
LFLAGTMIWFLNFFIVWIFLLAFSMEWLNRFP